MNPQKPFAEVLDEILQDIDVTTWHPEPGVCEVIDARANCAEAKAAILALIAEARASASIHMIDTMIDEVDVMENYTKDDLIVIRKQLKAAQQRGGQENE